MDEDGCKNYECTNQRLTAKSEGAGETPMSVDKSEWHDKQKYAAHGAPDNRVANASAAIGAAAYADGKQAALATKRYLTQPAKQRQLH
jgi:hypothetical protein